MTYSTVSWNMLVLYVLLKNIFDLTKQIYDWKLSKLLTSKGHPSFKNNASNSNTCPSGSKGGGQMFILAVWNQEQRRAYHNMTYSTKNWQARQNKMQENLKASLKPGYMV